MTTTFRRGSDSLPSATRHGAEAFGAQKRACIASGATVFTPQHATHAPAVLCNFTGPPVIHACTHTHTHTDPCSHTHTLATSTPPHRQQPGHCFPSQSRRKLTGWPPGGSPLPLKLDWSLSPGNQKVRLVSPVRREAPVQNKKPGADCRVT